MTIFRPLQGAVLAAALGATGFAQAASTPIQFNPNGTGANGAVTVQTFDWAVSSALAKGGNPGGGLTVGSSFQALSQAALAAILNSNGQPLQIPAGTEFTFVAGVGETVTFCSGVGCATANFIFDPTQDNFFEIWVKTAAPYANNLAGTGFAPTSKRILYGTVTDASGNFAQGACTDGNDLDLFNVNDWPGQTTICGAGSTKLAVQVISLDPGYFPGFTPTQVATLKAQFNTSTVTPFRQADPSRQFIGNSAGIAGTDSQPFVVPDLFNPNGGNSVANTIKDFEFQADANQAFEQGTEVAGACRVTYGGNDANGNVNVQKNNFASACSGNGKNQDCYTFGGQVGAPTADPNFGGPFGEHTHHNTSGPSGDFVFHAGTHSAPKPSRITATACKDPGACRNAEANAGFKQIDFEGTGTFRTLDPTASSVLAARAGHPVLPDSAKPTDLYYFRVDMDDFGEPGNKFGKGSGVQSAANSFFAADQNNPLSTPDPLLSTYASCNQLADIYQFFICKDATPCDPNDPATKGNVIYAVRAYLTGGNIQLHRVIK